LSAGSQAGREKGWNQGGRRTIIGEKGPFSKLRGKKRKKLCEHALLWGKKGEQEEGGQKTAQQDENQGPAHKLKRGGPWGKKPGVNLTQKKEKGGEKKRKDGANLPGGKEKATGDRLVLKEEEKKGKFQNREKEAESPPANRKGGKRFFVSRSETAVDAHGGKKKKGSFMYEKPKGKNGKSHRQDG